MAIRIVIADDTDLVILGAQSVLNGDHRFQVVGTARCVPELLAVVEAHQPDVVVLNEWLYNLDILTTIEHLRQLQPSVKIIVMGGLVDGLLIRDLFASGVSGYLYKSDDLCQLLVTAIHTAMLNRPYLSPTANAEYLVAMQSPMRDWHLDDESRRLLRLLMQGEHIASIAEHMNISTRRVYWLRQRLKERFGAKTNEHLISRAASEGFIYVGE